MMSTWLFAIPMNGLSKSSSLSPAARRRLRWGARSKPFLIWSLRTYFLSREAAPKSTALPPGAGGALPAPYRTGPLAQGRDLVPGWRARARRGRRPGRASRGGGGGRPRARHGRAARRPRRRPERRALHRDARGRRDPRATRPLQDRRVRGARAVRAPAREPSRPGAATRLALRPGAPAARAVHRDRRGADGAADPVRGGGPRDGALADLVVPCRSVPRRVGAHGPHPRGPPRSRSPQLDSTMRRPVAALAVVLLAGCPPRKESPHTGLLDPVSCDTPLRETVLPSDMVEDLGTLAVGSMARFSVPTGTMDPTASVPRSSTMSLGK